MALNESLNRRVFQFTSEAPRFSYGVSSLVLVILILCLGVGAWAAVGGSISGTIKDTTGGVIPGAMVTVTNASLGTQFKTTTDARGYFSFPSLPVGRYDLTIDFPGFSSEKKPGLMVDTDSALDESSTLSIATETQEVEVSTSAEIAQVQVETISTQLGDVVSGNQIASVALNGRSFTDLLALQPGIVPMTTQQPDSIVMAGVTVAIAPSGALNPGNQSISGQREDANGFMVNGGDVKELMNGGTSVVPDLDSIPEFRILTNNFDAEYGNYSGGVVNVVTKSGSSRIHGSGFEFLRNTALDARNFFSPERSFYRQNQFGGTLGGPIAKNKVFFFGDYQGTGTNQGIDTGLIPVPTAARPDRQSYRPGRLAERDGGRAVSGEPSLTETRLRRFRERAVLQARLHFERAVRFSECRHSAARVVGASQTSAAVHSDSQHRRLGFLHWRFRKETARRQRQLPPGRANSKRWGQLSAYYYFDDYNLNNPYPTGQGGATVPGFAGLNLGRSQLINLGADQDIRIVRGERVSRELHAECQ